MTNQWDRQEHRMQTKTIPERNFKVKDARGRIYNVTRYAWLDNVAGPGRTEEWREVYQLWMTENGGLLDPLGAGRFVVEGTGTLVETVE
jgi:hypothetical protein